MPLPAIGVLAAIVLLCTTSVLAAEPVPLTSSARLKFSPVYADPEGREIVFVELVNPALYQLQRLHIAEGSIEPLHPDASTSEFEPAFAPDGKAYCFMKTRGALSVSLVIRTSSGTTLGEVLPDPGFAGLRSPTLAPDHSRAAYSYADGGRQQIFSVAADGRDKKTLTDTRGINNWPHYSPDGRQIVFASSRDGNFEIYVMRSDGSDVRRLTDSPSQDIRPRFSPDGKQIAFTSHRDGNPEIYVMNADGSAPRRLTDHPDRDDYPDWHPDGRQIVFVSERGGKHELCLLRVE